MDRARPDCSGETGRLDETAEMATLFLLKPFDYEVVGKGGWVGGWVGRNVRVHTHTHTHTRTQHTRKKSQVKNRTLTSQRTDTNN